MTFRRMLFSWGMAFFLGATMIASGACSDDSGPGKVDSSGKVKDSGGGADLYPDLGALPDIGKKEPCQTEWIDAVHAQDKVSTGEVSTTETAGVNTMTIDASAGGMNGASKNPFVYISFTGGKRVDITDIASRTSKAWDLAFRRAVIRVNGGDSGAGGGAVARLSGKTFDEVTAAPAASAFGADEFIDGACKIAFDPINNIKTAFSGSTTKDLWYEYDMQTSKLTPKPFVWVIRRPDGSFIKMTIDSYYSTSHVGGHFTITWKAL